MVINGGQPALSEVAQPKKISRRTALHAAWQALKIGAGAAVITGVCAACGTSPEELQQAATLPANKIDPLPPATNDPVGEVVAPVNVDTEFDNFLYGKFPPADFYNCSALPLDGTEATRTPSDAEALQYLVDKGCQPVENNLTAQLTKDPTILALSTIALPATALDPIPGDEAIVLALLLIATTGVLLASINNRNVKIEIPTSHSSPSHDPKHPNGDPARRIIDTIVNGGAIERFCYSVKLLTNHPGAEEVVRTIITIGVQNAPYLSHLAWFDDAGWGGAYTIGAHPRDLEAIAKTSKYITDIVRLAAAACPSLPGANIYR